MTPSNIDPERLAALLDGRLEASARAEVLRELDADDELRALYADVAAVEGELATTAGVAGADVRPFRREAAPSRWRSGRVMLVAASLVGISLLSWNVATSRSVLEPYALVRELGVDGPVPLPAEPWAVTRGGEAPMSERGRAVRLGARLVDLEVAFAAGDSVARSAVASSIAVLATTNPPLTGAPVDLYRQIADGDAEAVRDRGARREGWDAMSELAGKEAMQLGAWLEAARVAAARRDEQFFRSRATGRVLRRAQLTNEEERLAMRRVRGIALGSASTEVSAPTWAELERALGEALASAAR